MGEERHLYSSMYQLVSTFGHLVFEIALISSNGQRRYLQYGSVCFHYTASSFATYKTRYIILVYSVTDIFSSHDIVDWDQQHLKQYDLQEYPHKKIFLLTNFVSAGVTLHRSFLQGATLVELFENPLHPMTMLYRLSYTDTSHTCAVFDSSEKKLSYVSEVSINVIDSFSIGCLTGSGSSSRF